jgi:hypothetical protein
MGIYTRPDSPYWWLFLETTSRKEKTDIKVGLTTAQRRDSRQLAEDRYHQRMNELAARLYKLPSAQPAIRFAKYAETYVTDTIAHRRGAEREREMLRPLVAFLKDDLLTAIDQDRTKQYMTHRRDQNVAARTVNREVDLLKLMIRDAAPKYLTASPLIGMKRLPVAAVKRRLLTLAEERKLLKKADRVERALLILGIDGLIRMGDLLDLRRTDRSGAWLHVADPKNGEPYEVVLTARAAKALDALPGKEPYYFQRYRGAKMDRDRRARVRRALIALCDRARVPYGRGIGITFHWATRKTGATRYIVDQKKPIPAIQLQGGWKKPDVLLAIYAEADKRAQKAAILPPRSRSKRRSA